MDGILEAEAVGPTGAREASPVLNIGKRLSGGGHFAGKIDNLRIYNFNMSPADIAVLSQPLIGDVNFDGAVDLLDVEPFIEVISTGVYQIEADCNEDGAVNLLDIDPFIKILSGG